MYRLLPKSLRKKWRKTTQDSFANVISGAGMRGDKSQSGIFTPSAIANNEIALETLYVESWAARKIINTPVDDSFIYPRDFIELSEQENKRLDDFNKNIALDERIKQALKAARLFGTAFLVLVSDDNVLQTPLNLNAKIFALKNILVITRFDATVVDYDHDITSTNFNRPLFYQFNLPGNPKLTVHHSRVIRVDGLNTLTTHRWKSGYSRDWGISILVDLYTLITQEESAASAVNYLLNEASIPILKIPDLQDALAGSPDTMGGSPQESISPVDRIVQKINDIKSIYRTLYLDASMELDRLEPSFNNIANIFNKFHLRLSAAADIPETRLFGKCPAGLNSTGDSDAQNYAIHIAALQQHVLRPIYDKIDPLVIKTLKLSLPVVNYEFRKLVDISDDKRADMQLKNAHRDVQYLLHGILSPEEVRQSLHDNVTYPINPNEVIDDIEKLESDRLAQQLEAQDASPKGKIPC